LFAIWPMVASIIVKGALAIGKFTSGKRLGSTAIQTDAWHEGIEIFSGFVALAALALSLYDQEHFAAADHIGGFIVGLIVLLTAFHVVRDTSQDLTDAMPDDERIEQIQRVALAVADVSGVEKTATTLWQRTRMSGINIRERFLAHAQALVSQYRRLRSSRTRRR
jgi:divalent metal cation (Fe/Co/Zn/Cd) transporter